MNRDTEELPAIMSELEENAKSIEGHQYATIYPFFSVTNFA